MRLLDRGFLLILVSLFGGALLAVPISASAAWDISTATYSGSSGSTSPATSPRGFFISADGAKLYLANFSNQTIYQFSLSTAWDISTLSYDTKSFSVSSQGSPQDVALSADGTKMFMLSFYTRVAHQYTLSTPWDISTASYDSESVSLGSANHYNFHMKRDGTKLFSLNDYQNRIQQYALSAWDLSTEVAGTNYSYPSLSDGQELVFSMGDDGENMYIGTSTSERIHWFTLSTPWDTSTASYSSSYKTISAEDSSIYKVFFNPSGTIMYASGATNDKIYQYTLDGTDPTVSAFSPTDDATGVAIDSDLVLTFDEAVDAEAGNIVVKNTANGATVATVDVTGGQVSGSGTTEITIDLTADLAAGTQYYVQIDATVFDDVAGNSYAGISDTSTWSFTTIAAGGGEATSPSPGGGTFLDQEDGVSISLSAVVSSTSSNAGANTEGATSAGNTSEEVVSVQVKIPDADQVQQVYIRAFGQKFYLHSMSDTYTYLASIKMPSKFGRYPYTLTADYGIFTLSSKNEFVVAAPSAAVDLLARTEKLLEQVVQREITNEEHGYWTKRVLAGEKTSPPELFGAMQWQERYGGVHYSRLPGVVQAL